MFFNFTLPAVQIGEPGRERLKKEIVFFSCFKIKAESLGVKKHVLPYNHTKILSHIRGGYSQSGQSLQAPNGEYWFCFDLMNQP